MRFDEKLTEIMAKQKLKTTVLAEKSGMSQSYVSDLKLGKRAGTRKNIKKILDALELRDSEYEEMLVLWSLAKGENQVTDKFFEIKKENFRLNSELLKVKNEIETIEQLEKLQERLENLKFFEGLLELPEEEFIVLVETIKEKLVYWAVVKGKSGEIADKLEEYKKLIDEIKK